MLNATALLEQVGIRDKVDVMDKSRYAAFIFGLLFTVAIALLLTGEGLAR